MEPLHVPEKPVDRIILGYVLYEKALQNLSGDTIARGRVIEYIRSNLLDPTLVNQSDGTTIQDTLQD